MRRTCILYYGPRFKGWLLLTLVFGIPLFSGPIGIAQPLALRTVEAASSGEQKEQSLSAFLHELGNQHHIEFVYESDLMDGKVIKPVAARRPPGNNERVSLEDALTGVLKPYALTYEKVYDNYYVIRKKGEKNTRKGVLNRIEKSAMKDVGNQEDTQQSTRKIAVRMAPKTNVLDQTISGKVTDGENGEPLPGVNVLAKGTTTGTVTDIDGSYRLSINDEVTTLVFSSIGYTSEEIAINGRSAIDLMLMPDIQSLSEIVVVGYGEQKRATVTGSVSSVEGREIAQAPVINVSNSLVGRLPGVSTVTRSGEPGNDASTIRIRGVNTLGNNDALVVVDGVPGRSLDRIDPNSIETITVLKDASAAIYGAQAANGVILITTKRGKTGKPEITLNLNQGFNQPTRLPQMADAAQYATLLNEIDGYRNRPPRYTPQDIQAFRDGSDPWSYPNTDWFGEVLKPWSGQNYGNISVSGGSENLKYFLLLGAKGQDAYYYNSATKYTQYDFRSNLDGKLSDHVNISFDIAGRQENRNFPVRSAGSIFRMLMRGKPHMPAYWPDGTPGPDIEYGDNPAVVSTDATGYDRDTWYVLNSNLRLNIDIPWVEGLSIRSNAALDKSFRFRKRFETPWYLYSWDGQSYDENENPVLIRGKKGFDDPRLTEEMEAHQNVLLNALINYEKTIAENHTVKLMAGTETRTGKGDRLNAYRRYFVSTSVDQMFAGGDAEKDNGGSAYQNARLNYFGRVNYSFSDKYLAEFVWRYDGSYIFPEGKRFGFFPGVSVGWRVSEESFWKNGVPLVDNLKLRASWGQTGNDRIDEWQYLSSYSFGRWDASSGSAMRNEPYIFGIDQENKTLFEARIPNRDVTWEIATQFNVGFEAGLFDSRFTVEAEYFDNRRSQILWWRNASIPTSTGLSLPRENIGKVTNRGYEFTVGYRNQIGSFSYQVSVNGGYSRNEITFWDEAPGAPEYQLSTGNPIPTDPFNPNNDLYFQAIGIFQDSAAVDAYPHWDGARPGDIIFEDVNADGVIDANDRVRNDKTNIPRFSGGASVNLRYKQFDLSVLFQGATGAVRYIQTESGDIGNFLLDFYENRWTPENPEASYPRTFNRDEEYWRNQRSTFWLRNTNYLRLKNLEFGYSLPLSFNQRLGIQNFRVYVSGFNLLTYSPGLKDFDPESDDASGQSYPVQRVVNAGISLTF